MGCMKNNHILKNVLSQIKLYFFSFSNISYVHRLFEVRICHFMFQSFTGKFGSHVCARYWAPVKKNPDLWLTSELPVENALIFITWLGCFVLQWNKVLFPLCCNAHVGSFLVPCVRLGRDVLELDAQTRWVNPSDWSEQNWDRLAMVQPSHAQACLQHGIYPSQISRVQHSLASQMNRQSFSGHLMPARWAKESSFLIVWLQLTTKNDEFRELSVE